MSDLNPKPPSFRPAPQISARELNKLREATRTQFRGVGITGQFGDRITFRQPLDPTGFYPTLLMQFVMLEEYDDVLRCTAFVQPNDGVALVPQEYDIQLGEDAQNMVWIAKPYILQQTPWDGKTVDLNGQEVTFTYKGIGMRTASTEGASEDQVIVPDYIIGDVILALPIATGYNDAAKKKHDKIMPETTSVIWMDMNCAARAFAVKCS